MRVRWGLAALITAFATAAHGAAPAPGTVAVVPAGGGSTDPSFVDAVGQALGGANFTLLAGHSRYVAEVNVVRVASGLASERVGKAHAAVGVTAVAVPLPSHKTTLVDMVTTTLTIRLVARGSHQPLWSGSAVTVQPADVPVAAKLARAAVGTYPETRATPVSVP